MDLRERCIFKVGDKVVFNEENWDYGLSARTNLGAHPYYVVLHIKDGRLLMIGRPDGTGREKGQGFFAYRFDPYKSTAITLDDSLFEV